MAHHHVEVGVVGESGQGPENTASLRPGDAAHVQAKFGTTEQVDGPVWFFAIGGQYGAEHVGCGAGQGQAGIESFMRVGNLAEGCGKVIPAGKTGGGHEFGHVDAQLCDDVMEKFPVGKTQGYRLGPFVLH